MHVVSGHQLDELIEVEAVVGTGQSEDQLGFVLVDIVTILIDQLLHLF